MAKDPALGIRLEHNERAALAAAAKADKRALSAMARKIISEWLLQHGWLTSADGESGPPVKTEGSARHEH